MKNSSKTYTFFTGAISPFLLFEIEFHSLFYVMESHKNDKFYSDINPASAVVSIGLLAYFEAFCKHQFTAIINIFPSLINTFASKRDQPKVEFSTIISFNGNFEKNLGFVLAENYDFGTSKSINSIFRDLLLISPFNKQEEDKFNEILYKRNLLVHHAGYYTLKSMKMGAITEEQKERAFKEAIKIDTNDYYKISDFLFEMAMKITRETVKKIKELPEYKSLSANSIKYKAVEELLQGVHDTLR